METDKMIQHIRKRRDVEVETYSVQKILEGYGMGMYANLCCDRICDAEKIDEKHVFIDFFNPGNILVDWIGLGKCSCIIEGYITEEACDKLFDYCADRKDMVDAQNNMLHLLRNMDMKKRKEILKELKEISTEEEYRSIEVLVKEELKARRITNKLYQKTKELLTSIYVEIRYFRVFSWLRTYIASREGIVNE